MIKFDLTVEETIIVGRIADRALDEVFYDHQEMGVDKLEVMMDITATHCNGCRLKLDELSRTDKFNFAHDIAGIYRHLNRKTGKLEDCFLPRFADLSGE